ncbi:M48 family metalloprotease [Rivibacter subsaxonicus]|nr:M48 family metalloprotease [Rivibacter subsaxonicus]
MDSSERSAPRRATRLQRALASLVAASLLLGMPGAAVQAQAPARTVNVAANQLPALGDSASEDVSLSLERKVGDRIMREIWRDPDYLDDPVLQEYLQGMWQQLFDSARARGDISPDIDDRFAWTPFLVRDKSVNAFALPGGYVGVHLGLIAMTTSPDELASVLAHEMSHVTQRHIARGVGASKTSSLIALAGLILGVIAASRNPDVAGALITGGQAASAQGQLNYSRDMEREADRVGYGVLTGAGYSPSGMAAMFEKMQLASRLNDNQGFPYLRTHPLTTERIGEARTRLGVDLGAYRPPPRPLLHAAMQARARVLADARSGYLQKLQDYDSAASQIASPTSADKLGAAYAGAMASILLKDAARAEAAVAVARPLAAGDAGAKRAVDLLAAEAALLRGDASGLARSAEYLEAAGRSQGGRESRAVLMLSAQRALASGAPTSAQKAASDQLQTWVALHPNDALAWQQLSQLWQRQGEKLRSVRAEAESRAAIGDITGAIDRLRSGQKLARGPAAGDFIEASVIDARLRQLRAQRRTEWEEDYQAGARRIPPDDLCSDLPPPREGAPVTPGCQWGR